MKKDAEAFLFFYAKQVPSKRNNSEVEEFYRSENMRTIQRKRKPAARSSYLDFLNCNATV